MKLSYLVLLFVLLSQNSYAQRIVSNDIYEVQQRSERSFTIYNSIKNSYFRAIEERQTLLDTKFKCRETPGRDGKTAIICSTAKDPKDSERLRNLNRQIEELWREFQAARTNYERDDKAHQSLVQRMRELPVDQLVVTDAPKETEVESEKPKRWWNRNRNKSNNSNNRGAASITEESK